MPLAEFDRRLIKKHNPPFLIGVDEAGRGPLAGPVVASAAIIHPDLYSLLPEINDSKLISAKKRTRLFFMMRMAGVRFGFGFASPEEIDRVNILQATFLAMRRALDHLVSPAKQARHASLVVVDGPHRIPGLWMKQTAVVNADSKSLCVACASIFAKVLRDRWMEKLDKEFPGYEFARHKGYSTPAHLSAIKKIGPSPVHRRSFSPVARQCSSPPQGGG